MNLWRDIPPGDKPPDLINNVVEVISGSSDKTEYIREWDVLIMEDGVREDPKRFVCTRKRSKNFSKHARAKKVS